MEYIETLAVFVAVYVILAESFNLTIGVTGLFALAHGAFFALGAYASGLLTARLGWPYPAALLAAAAAPASLGVPLAALSFRMSGDYLAITTMGFQILVVALLTNLRWLTGGATGLMDIPHPALGSWHVEEPADFVVLSWIAALAAMALCYRLVRSPFGHSLRQLRDDETVSRMLGRHARALKIQIFAASAALAGIAGSLYAHFVAFISPDSFTIHETIAILTMVIIGGIGTVLGPLIGAAIVILLPEFLTAFDLSSGSSIFALRQAIYAALLVAFVMFAPQGLAAPRRARAAAPAPASAPLMRFAAAGGAPDDLGPVAVEPDDRAPVSGSLDWLRPGNPAASGPIALDFRGLGKRFGGVVSIADFTAELRGPGVIGLVGPNGAGKTTIFNLVTGFARPDRGRILHRGRDLTRLPTWRIARRGIKRLFQDARLFPHLSVRDNVLAGVPSAAADSLWRSLATPLGREERARQERADAALAWAGLYERRHLLACELAFGEQKLVALLQLLMDGPEIVLLDEPASGLDLPAIRQILRLTRRIAERGALVLLVEHNLDVIRDACDEVIFLDQGAILARGAPEVLFQRSDLAEIYFGT